MCLYKGILILSCYRASCCSDLVVFACGTKGSKFEPWSGPTLSAGLQTYRADNCTQLHSRLPYTFTDLSTVHNYRADYCTQLHSRLLYTITDLTTLHNYRADYCTQLHSRLPYTFTDPTTLHNYRADYCTQLHSR